MHNQQTTTAVVLRRTDYGEADRIVTLLTRDFGKLHLIAKGVRRPKSKLAGGVELFSISNITFISGRTGMGTLVSARMQKHYGNIVKNIDNTMLGYELIKLLDKITEDETDPEHFDLLVQTLEALDLGLSVDFMREWFAVQLLRMNGYTPNLTTDVSGKKLESSQTYEFDFDANAFMPKDNAPYGADSIKFLRLLFAGTKPHALAKIDGLEDLVQSTKQIVGFLQQQNLHF